MLKYIYNCLVVEEIGIFFLEFFIGWDLVVVMIYVFIGGLWFVVFKYSYLFYV